MQYWYNIRTKQVEPDNETSRKEDLLGPYSSEEQARQAPLSTAARTEAWDEENRRRKEEEARAENRDPDEPGFLGF
ncbi:methionine aminopeptidase [Gephyromycinifex aptenodytis]|uniref:methionine aminopeptidase n=1 Tax=Gephyromycinifex aptenodytis TaxID=2716227 RepID=UPI0014462BE8|nr:methionine aminopeptidase [Gephyromycinifex aptenodytis]